MPRIVATFNFPGVTQEQYDKAIEDFKAAEAADPNFVADRVTHLGMPTEDGWLAIDVWDSPEAFEKLGATLGPILQKHGFPQVAPTVYSVHDSMT
jgi:hypothetical protein